VVLRRHRDDDLPAIVAQCRDEEMPRWTTVLSRYHEADARWFLEHVSAGWESGTLAAFAIDLDGAFAGSVDLRLQEGSWAEIGYGLGPWARGRGVMTEAVTMLLDWAFPALGLAGVEWRAARDLRHHSLRPEPQDPLGRLERDHTRPLVSQLHEPPIDLRRPW